MKKKNKSTELENTDKKLIISDVGKSLIAAMKVIVDSDKIVKVESVLPYIKRTKEEEDKVIEIWSNLPKSKNFL